MVSDKIQYVNFSTICHHMTISTKSMLIEGYVGGCEPPPGRFFYIHSSTRGETMERGILTKCHFNQQARHFDLAPDTAIPGLSNKSRESRINSHLSCKLNESQASERPVVAFASNHQQGTDRPRRHAR